MSSFCVKCGTKYGENSKFCGTCGNRRPEIEKPSPEQNKVITDANLVPPSPPKPVICKGSIEVSNLEAMELATPLIFGARAFLPTDPEASSINPEDFDTIKATMSFLDKLFIEFPEIKDRTWLAFDEYNKVAEYMQG